LRQEITDEVRRPLTGFELSLNRTYRGRAPPPSGLGPVPLPPALQPLDLPKLGCNVSQTPLNFRWQGTQLRAVYRGSDTTSVVVRASLEREKGRHGRGGRKPLAGELTIRAQSLPLVCNLWGPRHLHGSVHSIRERQLFDRRRRGVADIARAPNGAHPDRGHPWRALHAAPHLLNHFPVKRHG
jgi:hypothetical protein